jgi:hypothetical protein
MAKSSKIYAVIHRFDKPQNDGSFGVVVFNRATSPTQKEIDRLCGVGCDMIDDDELPPGASAVFWAKRPTAAMD